MSKKLLSLFLAVVMLALAIPAAVIPAFAAEGDAAEGETYKTSIVTNGENWPTWNANSGPSAEWGGDWQLVAMSPKTWNTGVYPATIISSGRDYLSAGGWMSGSKGAGIYGNAGWAHCIITGVGYSATPAGGTNDDRTVTQLDANAVMRYMAPYTGTVTISVNKLNFMYANNHFFAILVNGQPVGQFDVEGFDYQSSTGWLPAPATNDTDVADQIADITLDIKEGDVIDFAFRGNENYMKSNYPEFNYNYTKRSANKIDFSIEYAAGYQRLYNPEDKWMAENGSATTTLNLDQGKYLFRWYNADGSRIGSGSVKAGFIKINQYLIDNGIVAKTDTFKEAFDKWVAYMKETYHIEYSGNWSMGNMTANGVFEPIKYPGIASNQSLMNTSRSGNLSDWDHQFWVTEPVFDAQMKDGYNKTTAFIDPNALVSDIAEPWQAAMGFQVTPSTSSAHTVGGYDRALETGGKSTYWLRPLANANTDKQGAFVWTASASGVATIKTTALAFSESKGGMPYAIMVNGKIVKDWTTFNTQSATAVADMNEQFGSMEIPVVEGDQVAIVSARLNGAATRFYANFAVALDTSRVPVSYVRDGVTLQSFIAKVGEPLPELMNVPDFGLQGVKVNGEYALELPETVEGPMVIEDFFTKSAASITIASKYTINIYVKAESDAIGAGIIVGNEMFRGVKQADGTYKVEALTVSAGKLQTATFSYVAYQEYEDGYRINIAKSTVSSKALLQAYATGNYDATTKALASSVLDLAETLRAFIEYPAGIGPDLDGTVKDHLKGAYTIPGNYLSGKYDIYLGTLKQITTGEEPKYQAGGFQGTTFVPDATVTADDKVKMGYEEGVNPASSDYKYAIKAVTLNFEDRIGFAFRIVANSGSSVSDLREGGKYAIQVYDGKSYSYYDAFLYEGSDKNAKAIVVDGVPASRYDYDTEFTVVERGEDGTYTAVGATLTYSVKAYAVTTFTFGKADFASYLAQALFRLGVVADEYVAAHPVA